MRVLSRSDVQQCLTMADAIAAMRRAFAQLSSGAAEVPARLSLAAGDGVSLFMPAHLRETGALGLKVVSVHSGNLRRGLPSILAAVVLVDTQTGAPLALLDGATITALRTGAGSALATDYLARPDCASAAIIGAGPQARAHAHAMCAVRPIGDLRLFSRTFEKAQSLAEELRGSLRAGVRVVGSAQEAVRGADIVCCCTSSPAPVFDGRDLSPGTHINAVGAYTPDTRETDDETIRRASRIVVDSRATVAHEAGDLVLPMRAGLLRESDIYAELGELVLGRKSGRPATDAGRAEITLFKSVGNAAQDVAAAQAAFAAAQSVGLGIEVDLQR